MAKFNLEENRREKAEILKKQPKQSIKLITPDYNSTFDYISFDIPEEDRHELIDCEGAITLTINSMKKKSVDMAIYLTLAKEKLSKGKEGTFMAWYENLGLNKDFVSLLLAKYNLALEFSVEPAKTLEITKEMLRAMVGRTASLTMNETHEILHSEVPRETFKEIMSTKILEWAPSEEEFQYKPETIKLLHIKEDRIKALKPREQKKANNYLKKIEEAYEKLNAILAAK
jgi:hypothetical protein